MVVVVEVSATGVTDETVGAVVVVVVMGAIAAGASVTWSRTLPTAAAATNTAAAVTASQSRA